jgi:cytochrome c oxidase accessory protein FixG
MSLEEEVNKDAFRDSIATIDESGNRKYIYPKKPSGRFYKWRTYLSWGLLAVLFGAPWIKINGEPLLMLNVLERKFIILGQIFWPQDFYLFVIGMITMAVFIIVFTVIYGRIFCGWICPQTIFLEMVFRKIEYAIDGDWQRQKKLEKMPWNAEKIRKRVLKLSIFLVISFFIANTFLMYIIGSDDWIQLVTDNPADHAGGLTAMVIFTLLFFGVFSKFREQACIVVCPYGRLQGVLLDTKSILVTYDFVRGENRSRFKRREDRKEAGKGDCIDCHACVDVCPTGIDIRNGTQLECVNCTACIDACDAIMNKVGFEQGLIRYASEEQIKNEQKKITFTPRMMAYTAVLGVLLSVFVILMALRTDVETTLLRAPGTTFQEQADGRLSNLYQYKVINKTNEALPIHFEVLEGSAEIKMVGKELVLQKGENIEGALFIILGKDELDGMKTDVKIGVFSNGQQLETLETVFLGPI